MQLVFRRLVVAMALIAIPGTVDGQRRPGLMGDLIVDIGSLEEKVVGLAKAIPASAYSWRPGDGVRSISEVLIHVAGDNYFAAAKMGSNVSSETAITGKGYNEARAYEERKMTRGQVIAALEQSFGLLKKSMAETPDEKLEASTDYFGPKRMTSLRTAWVGATTHLHEHLGQLIAYARSNKIVPPWSK